MKIQNEAHHEKNETQSYTPFTRSTKKREIENEMDEKSMKRSKIGTTFHSQVEDKVYHDEEGTYYALLVQSDVNHNHNKYYELYLICEGDKFNVSHHYGRIGEKGAFQDNWFEKMDDARAEFKRNFKSKTGNVWEERDKFINKPNHYYLVEIDPKNPEITQDMPFGRVSQNQLKIGLKILDEIIGVIRSKKRTTKKLEELSSQYFSTIPHSFGRHCPPMLRTIKEVKAIATKLDQIKED
eukprot:gene10124-2543_t